jgi:hypothetical protein
MKRTPAKVPRRILDHTNFSRGTSIALINPGGGPYPSAREVESLEEE